jgi:ribosomal protein S18 acetylase RimI-like enzyme
LKYTIRRAEQQDLEKVISLAVDMVVHSVSPFRDIATEEVREFRRKDLAALNDAVKQPHVGIFLAEDEESRFLGHVVVVCGYPESSTGETQGWIFDLSVIPEAWSSGIGRALMQRAEAFTRQMGYKYLGLGVTTANERAVSFYEKLGFSEERKRMIKHLERPRLKVQPPPSPPAPASPAPPAPPDSPQT